MAVNASIQVHAHRREEFLKIFREQATKKDPQTQAVCELIQSEVGEDLDTPRTFHCHLKYKFPSREDAERLLQKRENHNSQCCTDIFLHGPSEDWGKVLKAAASTIVVQCWLVASSPNSALPNPKCTRPDGEEWLCLNAKVTVQPEQREELLKVLEHARSSSIQEEALCVEYQYGESLLDPNTFLVHQAYNGHEGGKEGFDKHAETAHYQQWNAFSDAHEPIVEAYRFRLSEYLLPVRQLNAYRNILLLDGGNGHELKQRGIIAEDGSFFAGMLANEVHPEIVKAVHHDFCNCGCEVLTTNSFVTVPQRVEESMFSTTTTAFDDCHQRSNQEASVQKRTQDLIRAAVECARSAATEFEASKNKNRQAIRVAGTVPPLTECYIASAVPNDIFHLVSSYEIIILTLREAGVDLLLAETLSTVREGVAVTRALSQVTTTKTNTTPLWLSFTIDDFAEPPRLRSGEFLEEAVTAVLDEAKQSGIQLEAIGINCASPKAVTEGVVCLNAILPNQDLQSVPRVLAYANAFQTTTSEWLASQRKDDDEGIKLPADLGKRKPHVSEYDKDGVILPKAYADYVSQWIDSGASIVGGCCGCSPMHLKVVRDMIDNRN